MVITRTCLRCGHEWSRRAGTEPKTCPKCRSPYWNRQRRGEQMSPISELEQSLEEKRRMEVDLERKRSDLAAQKAGIEHGISMTQAQVEVLSKEADALKARPERTLEQEKELEYLQDRLSHLRSNYSILLEESKKVESMLHVISRAPGKHEGSYVDRDLLLEALDEDTDNQLYADGARQYARRFAERIREGEFDTG